MLLEYHLHQPKDLDGIMRHEALMLSHKYDVWDALIRSKGFRSFDCRKMADLRNTIPANEYCSTLSAYTKSSDRVEGERTIYQGGFVKNEDFKITFGMERFFDENVVIGTHRGKRFSIASIDMCTPLESVVTEAGVVIDLKKYGQGISRETNHDFVHNATLGSAVFDSIFSTHNSKSPTIHGYENYSLALHQLIFSVLRHEYKEDLDRVLEMAFMYGDIADKVGTRGDSDACDILYHFLYYMLRNFVAGENFLESDGSFSRDRKVWEKALKEGFMSYDMDSGFVIKHERSFRRASIEEVSAIAYSLHFESPITQPGDWERCITSSVIFPTAAALG